MDLTLVTRTEGDRTVVEVGGEIDVYTAPQPARARRRARRTTARSTSCWTWTGVDFLDSTGLGVLVGALNRVRAQDGSLRPRAHPGAHPEDLRDHRAAQGVPDPRHRRGGRQRTATDPPWPPSSSASRRHTARTCARHGSSRCRSGAARGWTRRASTRCDSRWARRRPRGRAARRRTARPSRSSCASRTTSRVSSSSRSSTECRRPADPDAVARPGLRRSGRARRRTRPAPTSASCRPPWGWR